MPKVKIKINDTEYEGTATFDANDVLDLDNARNAVGQISNTDYILIRKGLGSNSGDCAAIVPALYFAQSIAVSANAEAAALVETWTKAEETREANEETRKKQEEERQTDTKTAINNANSKADLAATNAALAQSKADTAQTAIDSVTAEITTVTALKEQLATLYSQLNDAIAAAESAKASAGSAANPILQRPASITLRTSIVAAVGTTVDISPEKVQPSTANASMVYQIASGTASVNPLGEVTSSTAGTVVVYVIPTLSSAIYGTVTITFRDTQAITDESGNAITDESGNAITSD